MEQLKIELLRNIAAYSRHKNGRLNFKIDLEKEIGSARKIGRNIEIRVY